VRRLNGSFVLSELIEEKEDRRGGSLFRELQVDLHTSHLKKGHGSRGGRSQLHVSRARRKVGGRSPL